MHTGLGIAALVISVIAILVPVVTIYVVWLALILATIAAFLGNKAFPIAAALTCLVNLVFLSPLAWMALSGERMGGGSFFRVTTIILFLAPIAGLVLGGRKKAPVETV